MSTRVQTAVAKLKETGVRMTPQRHAILSYLMQSMTHPTADDIYQALVTRFPSMSVATVYNNLKVFIDCGLVKELTYGDDSSRFDADMTEHYHAICNECGKMVDFDFPPLLEAEKEAEINTGFKVKGHRMEVYGVCDECQHANSASSKRG